MLKSRTRLQTIELICKAGFSTCYFIWCTIESILIKEKIYKYFLCTWGCDGDAIKLNFLSVLYVEITVHRWFSYVFNYNNFWPLLVCQKVHSLQGEAFNTADPELVVCALGGKGGHIHKEVLGLRSSPGQRLAQCTAHMIVWIFPLIAKEWTRR